MMPFKARSVALLWPSTRVLSFSLILYLSCINPFIEARRQSGRENYGRKLLGACVPQQYPKHGALLPVSLPSIIQDLVWPSPLHGSDFGEWTNQTTTESDHKVVYALLADIDGFYGGPLWRSDYHGKADSWHDVTPKLIEALPKDKSKGAAGVVNIHWHPSKPERVLFQGRDQYHWVSEDGGESFTSVSAPGNTLGLTQEMKIHPTNPKWILAKAERDSCWPDFAAPDCTADLWISKDFGSTWKNLTEASKGKVAGVRDFEWGLKLPMFAGQPTPDETIFATVYPDPSGHKSGLYPGWDKDLHYVVSLDLFQSPFAKIVPCGNLFEVIGGKVFLAVPSECPIGPDGTTPHTPGKGAISSRTVTLYVSDGDGDDFVEACLPASLEDDGYNLVQSHNKDGAYILADHAEPGSWGPETDSPTSDVYSPAFNASLHTVALEDVYRRDFIADFSRIEGLSGIFIANQLDPAAKGPMSRGREAAFLRTRLSMDGGASWQSLKRPKTFRYGLCNSCPPNASAEQCALHLHGPSSWLAPEGPHPNLYSSPAAPGLLLATGNVGPHLDFSPDADCTWLSRDGGQSWEDIAANTAIYEIGNSGALVVMASHRSEGPTKEVLFSVDQGECFHTVNLPEAILVDNIQTAPGNQNHIFLVHGIACLKTDAHPDCSFTGGSAPVGKLFAVDIQELIGSDWKECNSSENSSDYEAWDIPHEGSCLLGAKRRLRRKARDAFCFHPIGYRSEVQILEPCQCSLEDIECEFGYIRDANNTCAPIASLDANEACPRLATSDYKASSTHLRLIHGDMCKGVNDVIPDTNGKGGKKGSKESAGDSGKGADSPTGQHHSAIKTFFVFLLVTGVLAVAGALVWIHCLTAETRELIQSYAAPILSACAAVVEMGIGAIVEAYDWCRNKARPLILRLTGRDVGSSYFDDVVGYEPLRTSEGVGEGMGGSLESQGSPSLHP